MKNGREEREALRHRIEEARWKVAWVIRELDDGYLPLYERLTVELTKLDSQEDSRAEALRLAAAPRPRRRAA